MDFWAGYLDCVLNHGVLPEHAKWYVNWANRFARAVRGVPLRKRSVEDVRVFLDDLKADENTAPWQVDQARQALRLLYRDYLKIDPASMPKQHENKRRDAVRSPNKLEQLHGRLLEQIQTHLQTRHYSPRTREAYVGWTKRFISFHEMKSPLELGADDIRSFLDYLATERGVASSTQNQALNAIVFLYSQVLEQEPGDFSNFVRAKMPRHTPEALSRQQVSELIHALPEPYRLMAILMYGGGLRIMECLHLKVRDIGFDQGTIHVRAGKGAKDRTTLLPESAVDPLKTHLQGVQEIFEQDRLHEPGLEWYDQLIFPSRELRVDPRSRTVSRGHMNHNSVQKALKTAARKGGIAQKVTPHLLRHSFATHLYEQGCHIQTIQELLGHSQESTTMIYTHPMNYPGKKPVSPLDVFRNKQEE